MSGPMMVLVPFRVSVAVGWRKYEVACPIAPVLTASGFAIKHAGEIPADYTLQEYLSGKAIGDMEAAILERDGSSRFIGVPPACY